MQSTSIYSCILYIFATLSATVLASAISIGYQPAVATEFGPDCALEDPRSFENTLNIVAGDAKVPIINNNGRASLASSEDEIKSAGLYHFAKLSPGAEGVYDLVHINNEGIVSYLAVFSDGHLGFISKTTEVNDFTTTTDSQSAISVVWTASCSGAITAGIIGGPQFTFHIINNALHASNTNKAVPSPQLSPEIHITGLQAPAAAAVFRCPAPKRAYDKLGARPKKTNGCGSDEGFSRYVPNLGFKVCCDAHDYCFDECSATFDGCNNAFETCLRGKCSSQLCLAAASVYSWAVKNRSEPAFRRSTLERCVCK